MQIPFSLIMNIVIDYTCTLIIIINQIYANTFPIWIMWIFDSDYYSQIMHIMLLWKKSYTNTYTES